MESGLDSILLDSFNVVDSRVIDHEDVGVGDYHVDASCSGIFGDLLSCLPVHQKLRLGQLSIISLLEEHKVYCPCVVRYLWHYLLDLVEIDFLFIV